jgi:NTP pyrophosphatase (non-canonical NTP hydrolase)
MLNELRDKIHKNAVNHGFYSDEKDNHVLVKLMLIATELGEAAEAYRKNHYANMKVFDDSCNDIALDKIIGPTEVDLFADLIKDSFEDEIADCIIRLLDLCGFMGINIEKHIQLKMWFNEFREYKHGKIC